MKHLFGLFGLVVALAFVPPASAALKIFACEPEWGALATELGGGQVSVFTATTAMQDPHHIQARPSLIAKARRADLVVCTGAELEIGWLPMILRQAGNPAIQIGGTGYFLAAEHVPMLDIPTRLDRSEGDVHPYGNPHIQTDPRNIARVASALAARMAELDPADAAGYRNRLADFQERWDAAMARWATEAAPLKGVPIVVYHKGWAYLNHWLGLNEVAQLEPKPGIPPTASHLAAVKDLLQAQPAKMVIQAPYADPQPARWLSEHVKINVVTLPFTVGGTDQAKDLFGLFDDTVRRLLEGGS